MSELRSTLGATLSVLKRLLLLGILFSFPVLAQQDYINRYTVYTGFDYVISPSRNLTERGFDIDAGITIKPWLGLGGDFGFFGNNIISGAGTINGSETVYAAPVRSLGIDPSTIHVPFTSTTYIFAVGPQFYLRKWKAVTFLGRPGFGGIHESANLTLPPQLGPLFSVLGLPIPNPHQSDTTWFVGLGGGFDLNLSRHVGVRVTADWVNTHLFSNLLTDRQNYARFTIGPVWRWGEYQ
jgi:Outer membrane protein beta-barrel domain